MVGFLVGLGGLIEPSSQTTDQRATKTTDSSLTESASERCAGCGGAFFSLAPACMHRLQ